MNRVFYQAFDGHVFAVKFFPWVGDWIQITNEFGCQTRLRWHEAVRVLGGDFKGELGGDLKRRPVMNTVAVGDFSITPSA